MKIEMDDNTTYSVWAVSVCLLLALICYLTYHYNLVAYEKGYTQKTFQGLPGTYWVKE